MAKVAFLGTGLIGGGMAHAALERGDDVTVWNRTPEKARPFATRGAKVAPSSAEAVVGAERVHLALTDDDAVEAVLWEAGRKLGAAVVVDHTTTLPQRTSARAARLAKDGVAYLHAPVFMSPAMCRSAKGLMLVAGPPASYARVKSGLAQMTSKVDYLGERADLASAYKLFGNAMILTVVAGFADVLAMASSLGIAPEDAHRLFESVNPAATLAYRGAAMAKGDYAASFELTMARKDVRLMIECVEERLPLGVLPALAARMDQLLARGHGSDDVGVLAIEAVPRKGMH